MPDPSAGNWKGRDPQVRGRRPPARRAGRRADRRRRAARTKRRTGFHCRADLERGNHHRPAGGPALRRGCVFLHESCRYPEWRQAADEAQGPGEEWVDEVGPVRPAAETPRSRRSTTSPAPRVASAAAAALAGNTRATYASQWNRFCAWCDRHGGVDPLDAGAAQVARLPRRAGPGTQARDGAGLGGGDSRPRRYASGVDIEDGAIARPSAKSSSLIASLQSVALSARSPAAVAAAGRRPSRLELGREGASPRAEASRRASEGGRVARVHDVRVAWDAARLRQPAAGAEARSIARFPCCSPGGAGTGSTGDPDRLDYARRGAARLGDHVCLCSVCHRSTLSRSISLLEELLEERREVEAVGVPGSDHPPEEPLLLTGRFRGERTGSRHREGSASATAPHNRVPTRFVRKYTLSAKASALERPRRRRRPWQGTSRTDTI